MKLKSTYSLVFLLALAACSAPKSATSDALGPELQAIDGQVMTVAPGGSTQLRAADLGPEGGIQIPEFRRRYAGANDLLNGNFGPAGSSLMAGALSSLRLAGNAIEDDRVPAKSPRNLAIPSVTAGEVGSQSVSATTAPGTTVLSVDGLNFRQQRLANNGNQFSVEPPDQGLCVGNGYVLESVNTVLRIFKTDGTPATGVVDLNTFYGYPAAIDRTKPAGQPRFGPSLTDPICLYDQETKRFYHVVLTIATDPVTGGNPGPNSLDIAVSKTSDPLGEWIIYRIPAQNDGTQGTPNHGCSLNPDGSGNGPCLADYPQLSLDGEGLYITTNEFSFFGPEFKSSNVYAISKWRLSAGEPVRVVNFETVTSPAGVLGYTLQGANVDGKDFDSRFNGTQYFLSSTTADRATSDTVAVWALTGTRSLYGNNPSLKLTNVLVNTNPYGDAPLVDQKAGDFPLGQCINDTTLATPFGPGCWQFLFVAEPAHNEVVSKLNANDSRMHKVGMVGGLNAKLWGALPTALNVGGQEKAGIAWFIIKPKLTRTSFSASVERQGYLAALNNNLIFPEIAINRKGKGVMGFTIVGPNRFPSAAYATIDGDGTGPVQIAADGAGPQDGFTGYKAFRNPPRPRWGDYGGAAVDPATGNIWVANEYIAQTCTLAQYVSAPFGSCGGTRATLGNWATRITLVKP